MTAYAVGRGEQTIVTGTFPAHPGSAAAATERRRADEGRTAQVCGLEQVAERSYRAVSAWRRPPVSAEISQGFAVEISRIARGRAPG
eukprot:6177740-Pleurochrysis_carterae.AAC.2